MERIHDYNVALCKWRKKATCRSYNCCLSLRIDFNEAAHEIIIPTRVDCLRLTSEKTRRQAWLRSFFFEYIFGRHQK